MPSSVPSISLPPHSDSFTRTWFKHQFLPHPRPQLDHVQLTGLTAIVTGSNIGIGLECARILLSLQLSNLILAVRSLEKGEAAATSLRKSYPNTNVEVWHLDLASYESIRDFARKCATLPRFDIAILNAGIMNEKFNVNSSTGHEETFQVNYLSTALLALLLVPILTNSSRAHGRTARMTIVSSVAATTTSFPEKAAVPLIPSLDKKEGWSGSVAKQRYDVTKLLLQMFVLKLSQIIKAENVIVNTVDPGFTAGTGLFRNLPELVKITGWPILNISGYHPKKGAWAYVDAAVVRGDETHGSFLSNWQIHAFHPLMYTREGEEIMSRLWDETLGEFDFLNVQTLLSADI